MQTLQLVTLEFNLAHKNLCMGRASFEDFCSLIGFVVLLLQNIIIILCPSNQKFCVVVVGF
jgi:hypothetical protein